MANFNIYISQYSEEEIYMFYSDPSSLTVARGDTVTFIRSDIGGLASTINISSFPVGVFTSTASISISTNGASAVKTIRTDATLGSVFPACDAAGYTSFTIPINVTSGIDTTPDDFTFNNVTLAQPSSVVESNQINITGINVSTSVSVTNGSFMVNNDGVWRTSGSILNTQRLRLKLTASPAYNTTVSTNCTVGTVTKTWTVTTPNDPGNGEVINFPITSGTIKFSDILAFFGGVDEPGSPRPTNLRSYLKGAGYVPNITKNAGIPASGLLKVRDFLGSGTALYFLRYPAFKYHGLDNLNGPVTVEVEWGYLNPFDTASPIVGFGDIARSCEYRYKVVESTSLGYTTGVTSSVVGSIGAFSAWSSTVRSIRLSTTIPTAVERFFGGIVTFEVRSTYDTSVILTATAGYEMSGYGR